MIRKFFKWLGRGLLALIAISLAGYLFNKTYMDRYFRMAGAQIMGKSQDASWYDPVDKVPGAADQPLPIATPQELAIDPGAIEKASSYAQSKGSFGFVVWQGGKLQHAAYWQGFDRNRLIASKSMAKMIGGLVIGRAIAEGYIKSIDQPVSDYITAKFEWHLAL
jgi:CubicO group peptidase (beta-lactamase class C family)